MGDTIRTERLTKFYGRHRGIQELDLAVRPGEVFGFLGPNGAGKTTTIRLLLDLIRPTSGRAEVLGMDTRARSGEIRRRVGYLPGEPGIDPDKDIELTVSESTLHIRAERRVEKETHDKDLYRSEFRYGVYVKSLPLPVGFDEDTIEATYKAGILEIRVPVDQAKASATKIPVSTA